MRADPLAGRKTNGAADTLLPFLSPFCPPPICTLFKCLPSINLPSAAVLQFCSCLHASLSPSENKLLDSWYQTTWPWYIVFPFSFSSQNTRLIERYSHSHLKIRDWKRKKSLFDLTSKVLMGFSSVLSTSQTFKTVSPCCLHTAKMSYVLFYA